ncbi:hypothetical protein [Methylocystis heyeri]|uniref:Uncharacterized protein n=1 Tax=Methylocystis heyeri TaxID=391905 RepID=A0A6B8KC05_9HYPH|nr:hypothetical protein [Methylocystis heyeri]QGM44565.1 hypothetical protein H2LOC_002030 [Methylocystis heyeri]
MVLESLLVLLTLAAPGEAPVLSVWPGPPGAIISRPAYSREERAVDNWRIESALSLDVPPIGALRQALAADSNPLPRCVKLNNYWCVKHAGWNGEITADSDGHVAFSSAQHGAAAAALLLKRYYLEFKRRTAREIAARWAPAECWAAPVRAAVKTPASSREGLYRMLPQRPLPMGLAPHGLANTLRARWLAAHSRGGPLPMSRVSGSARAAALELAPAPEIAQGMGEPAHKKPAIQNDAVSAGPPGLAAAPAPALDCSAELVRIGNYASHIAEGVVSGPDQDLALFDPAGQPTENLSKVMANMAAVEIGPLRAQPALIARAVDQLRRSAAGQSETK